MADPEVLYGPTFSYELDEAGLRLPISWTPYEIFGRENLTAQENADLDAVIATHDPTKQIVAPISNVEWISRFTNAEYRAATAAAWRGSAGNAKNWDVVAFEAFIDTNKKKTQTLKEDLVSDGILTQERADEIFS